MADEPKETETAPPAAGAEDAAAVTPVGTCETLRGHANLMLFTTWVSKLQSQKAVAEAMAAAELSEEPLELYPDVSLSYINSFWVKVYRDD